jgi:ArsR family transcriptional regulator, arsenate/arsenite/antimonite-responsive transcriptional repressor / arsenate reductase (thioredoxin)
VALVPNLGAAHCSHPPEFFRLAGHPLRWRLLSELARSDRRVAELCSLVGQPQNLVSYHLSRLRAEQVVFSRRSAADGRDAYYAVDLDRCGDLIRGAAVALHPGLRSHQPARTDRPLSSREATRMLFLCTGNSARSQIAEALAEQLSLGMVDAASAGSHPKPLHPNAVRALRDRGIDISHRQSKNVNQFTDDRFEYVITLCDRVREVCPEFPGHPDLIHWSIPDPARGANSDRESYPSFERTLIEIETRVRLLLRAIEVQR